MTPPTFRPAAHSVHRIHRPESAAIRRTASARHWARLRFAAALLAAAVTTSTVTACGSAGDAIRESDAWATTVDTLPGGTPRVVNTPPSRGSDAAWTAVEELRIGTMEGDGPASFGQLKSVVVLDDGRIVVLDAQAQELRVFDADGVHLATHGGEGEGPGEFLNANGVLLSPEGLLVIPDQRQQRMTFIDPSDGFVRSQSIVQTSYGWVYQGAMLADGRIVKPSSYPGATIDDPRTYYVRIFSPDATSMDSVFLPPAPVLDRNDPPTSFSWELPGGRGGGVMGITLAESGTRLFHPDGTVWSSRMLADGHRLVNTSLDMRDTLRVVETARPPISIADSIRDAEISRIRDAIAEYGGDIGDQSWEKVPRRYPFVERIVADADGNLWVETGTPSGSLWDVFDPDGRHLRTVSIDLPLYPYVAPVIRGNDLWAVVTDEFDVGYVIRARIVEVGPGGGD